jgi:hypothetical protein
MPKKRQGLIASRPVYEGERSSRTNTQQVYYCGECDRLATHRWQEWDGNQAVDHFDCETHTQLAIKTEKARRIRALPAYVKFLRKTSQWKAQQETPPQESML